MRYTVYGVRGRGEDVFSYVGCTESPLKRRLAALLSGKTKASLKLRTLKAPEIVPIAETNNETKAAALEQQWIRRLRKAGHPLANAERKSIYRGGSGQIIMLSALVSGRTARHVERIRERLAEENPGLKISTSDAFRMLIERGLEAGDR